MRALLVIDVQNDFCTHGALATLAGEEVIPPINAISGRFDVVVASQDWHPRDHVSFASNHGAEPFTTIELPYGTQVLWPEHCIQGTPGVAFHPDLDTAPFQAVIRKGFHRHVDSYSAFRENDRTTDTGLRAYLTARGVTDVFVCGLATDYCVRWTALDAQAAGFTTSIVEDACRPVARGSEAEALAELTAHGIAQIHSTVV